MKKLIPLALVILAGISAFGQRYIPSPFNTNSPTAVSNVVTAIIGQTALNATQLLSGTVADARLAANIARTSSQSHTNSAHYGSLDVKGTDAALGGAITSDGDGKIVLQDDIRWVGTSTGNGAGITNLSLGVWTNATLWVDAASGNDVTARRGDPVNPYATITAGVGAAIAGDEIVVLPGYYSENVGISNTITLYLSAGVTVFGKMVLEATNVVVRGEGVLTNLSNVPLLITHTADVEVKEINRSTSGGGNNSVVSFMGLDIDLQCGGTIQAKRVSRDFTTTTSAIYDVSYNAQSPAIKVFVDHFDITNTSPIIVDAFGFGGRTAYIAPCFSTAALSGQVGTVYGGPITVP